MSIISKPKPKTSEKQFRLSLSSAGMDKELIDDLVRKAQLAGTVTTTSRGKLDTLKTSFPEFAEICEQLEVFELENKEEIDRIMVENGFPPVSKMSINVAK